MSSKTRKLARDIRLHVFNRPTNSSNGSGAFVSSVQVMESAEKPDAKKASRKKRSTSRT